MKLSEVRKNGLQIIKDVYSVVLKSDDRDLWREAIDSMHKHISNLKTQVRGTSAQDNENATFYVRELWAWESARKQMCTKFGRKFISHPTSHAKAKKSL